MIKINNLTFSDVSYDVRTSGVSRTFEKLAADSSGRTQDGNMHIDLIGVFCNYKMTLHRGPGCNLAQWDAVWEELSKAEGFTTIQVPYNQTWRTFEMYITKGTQELVRINRKNNTEQMYWDDIELEFIMKKPYKEPA